LTKLGAKRKKVAPGAAGANTNAAAISAIQTVAESLCVDKIEEGTQYKELTSYKYDGHKCQKIVSASHYIYTHGVKSAVDMFDPKDLSHVK